MILSLTRPKLRLLILLALAVALAISLFSVRLVRAETQSSDLSIRVVSAPKHAKACQVFEATYEITNLGPDAASSVYVLDQIPDALGTLDIQGVPSTLGVGETAIVTVTLKVVAFIPGESRNAWVGRIVGSDANTDSHLDNNPVSEYLNLIGKPQQVCS